MRKKGQGRVGGAAAAATMVVVALGAAELGAFVPPAAAAPAHGPGAFSKAYQRTVSAKSSDVSLAIDENADGEDIKITASGAFDYAHNDGQLKMNVNIGSGLNLPLTEILAKGQAYVQLPAADQQIFGGKPWIAVPVGNASSGVGGESPTSTLSLLEASASKVTKVGTATIDGVPTTEYKANVNPKKAVAKASPVVKKALSQALSEFSGLNSLPVEVWIDGQNRVRQVTEDVSLTPSPGSAAASVGSVKVVSTVDLSNYGVPVSVAAPPPSQVTHKSLEQLLAGAGGGSSTSTSTGI